MKRHLIIGVTLAALVLPGLVQAGSSRETTGGAVMERGSVDAAALANLLVEKGLVTPEEWKMLTQPRGAAAPVDKQAMEQIFRSDSYQTQ